jgi:hypothetical protein
MMDTFPKISWEETLKNWHMFLYLGAGVLVALMAPVNTVIAGFMTPLLSSITSGKGSYV